MSFPCLVIFGGQKSLFTVVLTQDEPQGDWSSSRTHCARTPPEDSSRMS